MTEDQADRLAADADRAAVGVWMAIDGWISGRETASMVPGGPEAFAAALTAQFVAQMAERGRSLDDVRGVLAQLAPLALEFLSPGSSRSLDLSGAKRQTLPLANPYWQISGPSIWGAV